MGCNGDITDFVKGVMPPGLDLPSLGDNSSKPGSLKVSPGQYNGVATGGNGAIRANVTTTDRMYTGGDISASLTINRTRVTPQ